MRVFLFATLAIALTTTAGEPWKLEPGVTQRGKAPESWSLDLRGKTIDEATAAAVKLSTRLYGKAEPALAHPVVFKFEFPAPKTFAFELAAVSSAGSDLVVKVNGEKVGDQQWPKSAATRRARHLFYVPLPEGPATVSLEVTQPAGVVVIDRYHVADDVGQLPKNLAPTPFSSGVSTDGAATPARNYSDVPMTGGKLECDQGYRGIWYYNQPTKDEYKYKYSGGYATYPQQHEPIAIYSKAAEKTFFVYGGTTARNGSDKQELLHMVSYYDHKTGQVPRPRILLNKHTSDAHDNPTLQIDSEGYLWVFSAAHGTGRPAFIHRSTKPYSIDEFQRVVVTNFSYTQPWYIPGDGFLFLHTHYGGGKPLGIDAIRCLFWMTSPDGFDWSPPHMLAGIELGDYSISWRSGKRVGIAFDYHPRPLGLNGRSNVHYLETDDLGKTWRTAAGEVVKLPLTSTNNPALVYDSCADGLLAYLKDINFDHNGHPVILFTTSKGFEPGPANGPRLWQTLRWTGKEWVRRPFTSSGNNYDHGSLYIEPDGTWLIIAPTETGPQPYNPGGEMVLWTSQDEGQTWQKIKQLTHNSKLNHTYARRPFDAQPDFYALWADGNARKPSECNLYFTNQRGDHIWRLPAKMKGDFAKPERLN